MNSLYKTLNRALFGASLGIFIGMALATIAFQTSLARDGASTVGLGPVYGTYFLTSLGVSVVLLIMSSAVRRYWHFPVGFFFVTVMVLATVGMHEFVEGAATTSGSLANINEQASLMMKLVARLFAVAAPGGSAAICFYLDFNARRSASKAAITSHPRT